MSFNVKTDLRQTRRDAGMSQEALARRAGCSLSMVQLLERGYKPATSDVLIRIVAVLHEDEHPAGQPGVVKNSTAPIGGADAE